MTEAVRKAVHIVISGRVQGVWYRGWTEREALRRRLDGWVRNRRDGTVEALFSGPEELVSEMIEACGEGPPAARVVRIDETSAAVPPPGFHVLPTE